MRGQMVDMLPVGNVNAQTDFAQSCGMYTAANRPAYYWTTINDGGMHECINVVLLVVQVAGEDAC